MGIIIRLGGVGSGKSLCAVRELVKGLNGLETYTNIETKGIPNVTKLKPEMIIKRDIISVNKQGTPKFKMTVNSEFWKSLPKGVNILIDEFHSLADSRRAMSNVNKTVNDFIALIRRVLGENSGQSGDLIVITQLERRIDVVLKELATLILFHICYYQKGCNDCGHSWSESSETAEKLSYCTRCMGHNLEKFNHEIHIHYFSNIMSFYQWQYYNKRVQIRIQVLKNMDKYFKYYNTVQWDNMFSEYY